MKINVPAEPEKESNETIFLNNLQALRFATSEALGSPNVHAAAAYLYRFLFQPLERDQLIDELHIFDTDRYPHKTTRLKSDIVSIEIQKSPPILEEFIKVVTNALIKKPKFATSLYPQASELLTVLALKGPVRIWTAGDMHGGLEYPGSFEQFKKIGRSDMIGKIRNIVAAQLVQNEPEKSPSAKSKTFLRKELLQVRAAENKMTLLPDIIAEFQKLGVGNVVVIEDRLSNLLEAMKILELHSNHMVGQFLWVRQGMYKDRFPKRMDTIPALVQSVFSLPELIQHFQESDLGFPGFIVDYDGVLSNDEKRQEIQNTAVYKACQERGWVL